MKQLTTEEVKRKIELGEIEVNLRNGGNLLLLKYKMNDTIYNTIELVNYENINILKLYEIVTVDINELIEFENDLIRNLAIDLIEEINKGVGAEHGTDFEMSDLALTVREFVENELIKSERKKERK